MVTHMHSEIIFYKIERKKEPQPFNSIMYLFQVYKVTFFRGVMVIVVV